MRLVSATAALVLLTALVAAQPANNDCMSWVPRTASHGIQNIDQYVPSTMNWVIGSADCDTCDVWGEVLPCFATDQGINAFGHRDYNRDWIWRDWCRVGLDGGTFFSHSMFLPVKGHKYDTLVWKTVRLGDVVPDNVISYNNSLVLARTLEQPSGCCTGKGFSGFAAITWNYTLTSVHFAVYTDTHHGAAFQVAVCNSYHPTTNPPPPTDAPATVPPTPVPIPTLPPTPVPPPPPPPTPVPPPPPPGQLPYVTRSTCVVGCDYNCVTYLYELGACYNEIRGISHLYTNASGELVVLDFENLGCEGSPANTTTQVVGSCVQLADLTYVTNQFYWLGNSKKDTTVTRDFCTEGCDYGCSNTTFTSGSCSIFNHAPTVTSCWPELVGVTQYFANTCGGTIQSNYSITLAYLNGQCTPTGSNDTYHTWSC